VNEQYRPGHIAFQQPPHLTFPDDVHHFVALDRGPSPRKGSQPLLGIDPPLDRSLVLLNEVVQVGAGSAPTAPTEPLFVLQLFHHLGI